MNLALEFASLEGSQDGDRFPVWIANGPVAVELDLWSATGDRPRMLAEALRRHTTRLLAVQEPTFPFVPRVDDGDSPWRVGLRFEVVDQIASQAPTASEVEGPGERVVVGDPAFRVVFHGGSDSATIRSDRAGIAALGQMCQEAVRLARKAR